MKLLFRAKALPALVAPGYSVVELLAVLALASGIMLSLLALSQNQQKAPPLELLDGCNESYWGAQQQVDETWMFGEESNDQCQVD